MLKNLILKKVRLLYAVHVIIVFVGFCTISNVFAMEPEKLANEKKAKEAGVKESQEWPKIEYYYVGDEDSVSVVAKIKLGSFIKSVAVQVSKNLKTGEFNCITYERGKSGILVPTKEKDYPEIVEEIKEKIVEYEKKIMIGKIIDNNFL